MFHLLNDSSPWKQFFCWKQETFGLGWGRGKPESSSSPVAVQSDFSPSPWPHVVDLPGPVHLCNLCSPNWRWEPSHGREGFLGKWGLWEQAGKHHSSDTVLGFVFSMFFAWSLFPPTVSAAQKPFNGSSQCRGSGRHGPVGLWYGNGLWLTGLQHHFPSVPCVLLRDLRFAKRFLWRVLSVSWEELRGRKLGKTQ